MKILSLDDIQSRLDINKIIAMQEEGFKAYSQGDVNVPPVGYIKIAHTPVRYHIKYGAIQDDDVFVVKLAGGLEHTTETFGPAKLEGMMLVISAKNGKPVCLLQDEGFLTNLRTAVAGLIAAKYLAPKNIHAIGVLGSGCQARLQVEILKDLTDCREVFVWSRNSENVQRYQEEMAQKGFTIHPCQNAKEVAQHCNLIITTTPADKPLLSAEDIQPGTHITAMGSDSSGKQELDAAILANADICAVDSKSQCIDHGESCFAIQAGLIEANKLIELGQIIADPTLGRNQENQLTVADLTGVAVQDIQIAKAMLV